MKLPFISGYGQEEFELTLSSIARINSVLPILILFSLCQCGLIFKKIQVETASISWK